MNNVRAMELFTCITQNIIPILLERVSEGLTERELGANPDQYCASNSNDYGSGCQ